MLNNIKLSLTSSVETITSTPFAKDVKKGGVFGLVTASIEGIERERLKSEIAFLEDIYKKNHDLEEVLKEYDEFSKAFKYRDTVASIRNRMINRLKKLDKNTQTVPVSVETQNILDDVIPARIVYVFELENGKYYVGSTEQMMQCYEQHKEQNCHEFTTKYKPIQIVSQTLMLSKYDELNTVLEYMEKYGVANVRGSLYQTINMQASEVIELQKTLMHTNEKKIKFDDTFNLDSTDVVTFVMHEYGKFTVDEIAQMRGLRDTTILTHLEKCKKFNVEIV